MPEYAGFLLKDFSLKREGLESAILFGFAYSEARYSGNIYENALFFSQKCPVKCLGTIFYGGNTPPPAYNPLFPHTGVGASISVDVKKNTEVSVGAEYQYDKKSREWKMETSGRVSIGF